MSGINIGNKDITATCAVCKILSGEHNPPMGILINAVPKMVEFLCMSASKRND
jgi:hypothetical protein